MILKKQYSSDNILLEYTKNFIYKTSKNNKLNNLLNLESTINSFMGSNQVKEELKKTEENKNEKPKDSSSKRRKDAPTDNIEYNIINKKTEIHKKKVENTILESGGHLASDDIEEKIKKREEMIKQRENKIRQRERRIGKTIAFKKNIGNCFPKYKIGSIDFKKNKKIKYNEEAKNKNKEEQYEKEVQNYFVDADNNIQNIFSKDNNQNYNINSNLNKNKLGIQNNLYLVNIQNRVNEAKAEQKKKAEE